MMNRSRFLSSMLLGILLAPLGVAQQGANTNASAAPADAAEAAWGEYQKADKEMNAVYKMLLEIYGEEKTAKEKLQAAQLAWLKYRDQAVSSEVALYSTIASEATAHHKALESLTRERTARLKSMIRRLDALTLGSPSQAAMNARAKKMVEALNKMEAGEEPGGR